MKKKKIKISMEIAPGTLDKKLSELTVREAIPLLAFACKVVSDANDKWDELRYDSETNGVPLNIFDDE
jgi:hypothetical protein